LEEPCGAPPGLDLAREARLEELAVLAAEGRWVAAAHDVSDGGLAATLAEMGMGGPAERRPGAPGDLSGLEAAGVVALFSERAGIVFEVAPERAARVLQAARERSLLAWPIGTVVADPTLRVRLGGDATLAWSADELRQAAGATLARLWNEQEVGP